MNNLQPGIRADTATPPASPLPLPPGSRLLHIGLMKTGTTAIQRAASARRRALLRQGVLYPGRLYNHRQAALALMNRQPASLGATPPVDAWSDLCTEVERSSADRVWVSNEFICGADEETASRFLAALGPQTHVVVTLRGVASILPSLWQQYVKIGSTQELADFLAVTLAEHPDPALLPNSHARHDQGAVVRRWAQLVGPEHLTVVIGDASEPQRVQKAFEGLLGLVDGTLEPVDARGYATNRSLTAPEAALMLEVNRRLPDGVMTEEELVRIVRNGAIRRMLEARSDYASDLRLGLPDWAAVRAAALGSRYADEIAAAGVTVVGDLADLGRRPEEAGSAELPVQVPAGLAAEALVGAISGGLRRGSNFGEPRPERARVSAASAMQGAGASRSAAARLRRLARGVRNRLRALVTRLLRG